MPSSHRIHFFHIIWSTKGRRNYILPKFETELYKYMNGIAKKLGGTIVAIGGIENHVHILLELSNLDHFTSLIKNIKVSSSKWLKQNYPECRNFAWQDGYSSYTVSHSKIELVRQYIGNQKEHHKAHTFESEYRKFLEKCAVKFDEKYLFDNADTTVVVEGKKYHRPGYVRLRHVPLANMFHGCAIKQKSNRPLKTALAVFTQRFSFMPTEHRTKHRTATAVPPAPSNSHVQSQ